MRKRLFFLLLCLACLLCACAAPRGVSFDADAFTDALCAHARAGDTAFSCEFTAQEGLNDAIKATLEAALADRYDCAVSLSGVDWRAETHRRYVAFSFALSYAQAWEDVPIADSARFSWETAVEDALRAEKTRYAVRFPAAQTDPAALQAALGALPQGRLGAYLQYRTENCQWSLAEYADYTVVELLFSYREDTVADLFVAGDPYAATVFIMKRLQDGAETIPLYVPAIDKEALQLLLWAAQINDSEEMVEEGLSGHGLYWDGSGGDYITELRILYSGTAETRAAYRAALSRVLDDMEAAVRAQGALSDEARYAAVCRAVSERCAYDDALSEASVAETLTPQMRYLRTAYGALVEGKSVCTGYAAAVKALCDRLSLPCWVCMGDYDGTGHAWNAVLLQGELRFLDATFYDLTKDDAHLLFPYERYAARPYALETGYPLPPWYTAAA